MDKTIKRPRKEDVEMEDVKMSDDVSSPPHPHANRAYDDSVNRVQREIEEVKESIKKTEVKIETTEVKIETTEVKIETTEVKIETTVREIEVASQNILNGIPAERDYWIQEKADLRKNESDLRKKESDLRKKESDLRKEIADLREKESDLRKERAKLLDDVRNASNIAAANLGPPQQVRGKTNKLLFILFIFYDGFLTFAPSMLCM
jgi:chromosome segregation ATPase